MKKVMVLAGMLSLGMSSASVQAGMFFSKAQEELQKRFINPMIDLTNTAQNTAKILKGTKDIQDRIRVAGSFVDQLSVAMSKLVGSLSYVNDTFVSTWLSKESNAKIKELTKDAQGLIDVAQSVATMLKKYERPNVDREIEELLNSKE
jgi:flagellar biosynthesis regulator FlaF